MTVVKICSSKYEPQNEKFVKINFNQSRQVEATGVTQKTKELKKKISKFIQTKNTSTLTICQQYDTNDNHITQRRYFLKEGRAS